MIETLIAQLLLFTVALIFVVGVGCFTIYAVLFALDELLTLRRRVVAWSVSAPSYGSIRERIRALYPGFLLRSDGVRSWRNLGNEGTA
jgi:hypothetical protein